MLTDANPSGSQKRDIVGETSFVAIGYGWSEPMTDDAGAAYRIARDGAELLVDPPDEFVHIVMIDLEPLTADATVAVEVVGSDGASIVSMNVFARQLLRLVLPGDRTDIAALRLRVKPMPQSSASVNEVRVHGMTLSRLFGDVVVGSRGLSLGDGWYGAEIYQAEGFRWVNNEAQILISEGFSGKRLLFDVEPGPAISELPMWLEITDQDGHEIARYEVAARMRFILDVPENIPHMLKLRAANASDRAGAADPRVLNFRVFQVSVLDKRSA
jgi:hypothetical protein